MKNHVFLFVIILIFNACSKTQNMTEDQTQNPFFSSFDTPFGVPPFDKIDAKHFMPAFIEAMNRHVKEIEEIAHHTSTPTFENTIVPLEFSGEMLNRVSKTFFSLYYAQTNDTLETIAEQISPLLSEHHDNMYLNEKLFERVKFIHNNKEKDSLTSEQQRLLDIYYKNFVRSGALLNTKQKKRFKNINKEIAELEVNFAKNVLSQTNDFYLELNEQDLDGLLPDQRYLAAQEATERGLEGKFVITLQKPSFLPFLQYSSRRDLREKIFKAYIQRANNGDKADNTSIVKKIVLLRMEKAHLLGFENHASFVLDDTMAKSPEKVSYLLEDIWHAALPKAKKEADELQKIIDSEGETFLLQAWDWWYYAEKLKKEKYNFDENQLRPYFKLENVRKGAFLLANKLWGLQFKTLQNMPIYDKDVEVFEVLDADGSHLGVLYTDYFPRKSKRSGAWMDELKSQCVINGKNERPIIVNVGNFSKPTQDKPSLLSIEEVETLFHEFGHALHGLLSQCTYPSLSGTNVTRDFVELPSQLMENWAMEPEMLSLYATHYQTSEVIPDSLIEKLQSASKFNQGFNTVELVAAAMLDLEWHLILEKKNIDVNTFEKTVLDNICLIPEIVSRYRSTYFSHIFSLGYDAGYYSYIWSEVLDADAFQAFKESGDIFNQELASSYRKNILEKGNTQDPILSYRLFRGYDPSPDALMIKRGLK